MAEVTLKGNSVQTFGDLPSVGSRVPDFTLTGSDLQELRLTDVLGGTVILNIFPR